MKEKDDFLIRGGGKNKGNIKRNDFYLFYIKHSINPVTRKKYMDFLKDLLDAFSTEIVETGLELKINRVGKIRIRSNPLHFFKKDGTRSKKLKPDWKATWEYWYKKYPDLSRKEIVEIKNKTVLFHENEHTQNEFYEHYWDKLTIVLKFKTFYEFHASRQYSRLIAKTVKDPNRKVFYYG